MSSPKDYSPPRYSIQVFNGKLNQVFQLQSRLKITVSELKTMQVSDNKLEIHFDCMDELGRISEGVDKSLKALARL